MLASIENGNGSTREHNKKKSLQRNFFSTLSSAHVEILVIYCADGRQKNWKLISLTENLGILQSVIGNVGFISILTASSTV